MVASRLRAGSSDRRSATRLAKRTGGDHGDRRRCHAEPVLTERTDTGQPPAQTKGAEGPFVTSGPIGAQLGVRMGYRFTRTFGLVLSPAANFMLPAFLFDLDLAAGVQVAF